MRDKGGLPRIRPSPGAAYGLAAHGVSISDRHFGIAISGYSPFRLLLSCHLSAKPIKMKKREISSKGNERHEGQTSSSFACIDAGGKHKARGVVIEQLTNCCFLEIQWRRHLNETRRVPSASRPKSQCFGTMIEMSCKCRDLLPEPGQTRGAVEVDWDSPMMKPSYRTCFSCSFRFCRDG